MRHANAMRADAYTADFPAIRLIQSGEGRRRPSEWRLCARCCGFIAAILMLERASVNASTGATAGVAVAYY